MRRIEDLRIGVRLGIGFGVMVAVAVGLAVYAALVLQVASAEAHRLSTQRLVRYDAAMAVEDNLNFIARAIRNVVLAEDDVEIAAELKRYDEAMAKHAELMRTLSARSVDAGATAGVRAIAEAVDRYFPLMSRVVELAKRNDDAAARTLLLKDVRPLQRAAMDAVAAVTRAENEAIDREVEAIGDASARARWVMASAAVLAAVFGLATAWVLTRSVVRPLVEAERVLEAVGGGDLTVRVAVDRADEIGELQRTVAGMVARLREVVGQVRGSADFVNTASAEIAAGSADLGSRAEQQASALEQTAASLEELSGAVSSTADTTAQAARLAGQAREAAERGGELVGRVVETMGGIADGSRRIGDITGVIDGIAFQTNILALNAAVEAARAGEQGRGFAVVASEVRALAQRCSTAAREIKTLVAASGERVEHGAALVGEAGQAMERIVADVREVAGLIATATGANAEQRDGVAQINAAVTDLDQTTQRNAALVEQTSAAAAGLRDQASRLSEAVAVFRT